MVDDRAAIRAPPAKHRAILTSEKAIEIFKCSIFQTRLSSKKPSAACVGREYGVSEKAVRDIWSARTWYDETLHLDPQRPARKRNPPGRPLGKRDSKQRRRNPSTCNVTPKMRPIEEQKMVSVANDNGLSRGPTTKSLKRNDQRSCDGMYLRSIGNNNGVCQQTFTRSESLCNKSVSPWHTPFVNKQTAEREDVTLLPTRECTVFDSADTRACGGRRGLKSKRTLPLIDSGGNGVNGTSFTVGGTTMPAVPVARALGSGYTWEAAITHQGEWQEHLLSDPLGPATVGCDDRGPAAPTSYQNARGELGRAPQPTSYPALAVQPRSCITANHADLLGVEGWGELEGGERGTDESGRSIQGCGEALGHRRAGPDWCEYQNHDGSGGLPGGSFGWESFDASESLPAWPESSVRGSSDIHGAGRSGQCPNSRAICGDNGTCDYMLPWTLNVGRFAPARGRNNVPMAVANADQWPAAAGVGREEADASLCAPWPTQPFVVGDELRPPPRVSAILGMTAPGAPMASGPVGRRGEAPLLRQHPPQRNAYSGSGSGASAARAGRLGGDGWGSVLPDAGTCGPANVVPGVSDETAGAGNAAAGPRGQWEAAERRGLCRPQPWEQEYLRHDSWKLD